LPIVVEWWEVINSSRSGLSGHYSTAWLSGQFTTISMVYGRHLLNCLLLVMFYCHGNSLPVHAWMATMGRFAVEWWEVTSVSHSAISGHFFTAW
jgi:hypothetical protein